MFRQKYVGNLKNAKTFYSSFYCNTCRVSLSYGSPLGSVVIYCAYEMPKQQTQFIKDNLLI